jgi:sialate O-acetylesterase
MKNRRLLTLIVVLFGLISFSAYSEVTLPNMLSSHMVLQRGRPIHLWGWADPGEQVTATLRDATQTTKADTLGHWSLYLPPEKAGGPYQITIAGTNRIVLDDVLIGDVWFASGQSNMEFPLLGFPNSAEMQNGAEEIRNANQPTLRLLHIRTKASPYSLQDVNTGTNQSPTMQSTQNDSWTTCTPETAATFSAVAYLFGREISKREHVPVGLIDSTWGGTPAEAWVSLDSLSADASLMPVFAQWAEKSKDEADIPRLMAAEKREDAAAQAAGQPAPKHPWHPNLDSWDPAWLYNGMVAPAINYPVKGVIWYQGESNSDVRRASTYERLFPALIQDWRKQWGEGDFPFLFVQISSFRSTAGENWPIIREAQRRALGLVNTGMAVTIDIGNPDNVHPSDKQDVAARLALAARDIAYGEQVEDSGPVYRQTSVDGGSIRVWFDHAEGLAAKGGPLTGFEVAGGDHNFVKAEARIENGNGGESIVVSSPSVTNPKYVRYGWQNAPVLNLFNSAGLPASPFTSEKDIPKPDPQHPTD